MSEPPTADPVVVAIDTGGTFTDAVGRRGSWVAVAKVPSTPDDPSCAVRDALGRVLAALGVDSADRLVHGTTVATNALLEGRGAETWMVVNAGFEDLQAIGRQARSDLYALEPRSRPVLVPPSRTVGVAGRLGPDGDEIQPLDLSALDQAVAFLDGGRRSWAVCLLHSYREPSHERAVAERLRALRPDDTVSVSSAILPVFREVERASTTVSNAFVRPMMEAYLGRLAGAANRVEVMGSSGGRLPLDVAAETPVLTALSGPAGGVVAALHVARSRGLAGVVSFDMGGTSTDVALCRDALPIRHASHVGGHAIHVPMLDIHTVGAGGGSVAEVDVGGALRVGPRSAGAAPGPACYGTGQEATVTDANVVLGRLPADVKLGGTMAISEKRARRAVDSIAARLSTSTERAAEGIIAIAVEKMAQAIRKISVERGVDPREFALCCFGGAGGLHACALAETLGMSSVVIPAHAGLLSAVGMLRGRAVAERSRTVLGRDPGAVADVASGLVTEATDALASPSAAAAVTLEMRYVGQSFELGVPYERNFAAAIDAFEAVHARRFGYRLDAEVEPVTVHVRVEGPEPEPVTVEEPWSGPSRLVGPQAVVQLASTTWVADGWVADIAVGGDIVLRREDRP